mgnify:CR=1 FL=1
MIFFCIVGDKCKMQSLTIEQFTKRFNRVPGYILDTLNGCEIYCDETTVIIKGVKTFYYYRIHKNGRLILRRVEPKIEENRPTSSIPPKVVVDANPSSPTQTEAQSISLVPPEIAGDEKSSECALQEVEPDSLSPPKPNKKRVGCRGCEWLINLFKTKKE